MAVDRIWKSRMFDAVEDHVPHRHHSLQRLVAALGVNDTREPEQIIRIVILISRGQRSAAACHRGHTSRTIPSESGAEGLCQSG